MILKKIKIRSEPHILLDRIPRGKYSKSRAFSHDANQRFAYARIEEDSEHAKNRRFLSTLSEQRASIYTGTWQTPDNTLKTWRGCGLFCLGTGARIYDLRAILISF